MASTLTSHLGRLNIPSTPVQQNAVLAIFQFLATNQNWKTREGEQALKECLGNGNKAVVEVAVVQLGQLVEAAGFPLSEAQDAILVAMGRAGGSAVGSLVTGLALLAKQQLKHGDATGSEALSWSFHPFSRAADATADSHAHLCCHVVTMMEGTVETNDVKPVVQFLTPFINHVLLTRQHDGGVSVLSCSLRSALVRMACTRAQLHCHLCTFLIRQLRWHPLGTPTQQLHCSCIIEDTVDAWDTGQAAESWTSLGLASVLLHVCCDAASVGLPLLLYISPIQRLHIPQHQLMSFALPMAMMALSAGGDEVLPLLTFVYAALSCHNVPGSHIGLLMYPLATLAMTHTTVAARQAALQLLRTCWERHDVTLGTQEGKAEQTESLLCTHGLPLMMKTCKNLLQELRDADDAVRWLHSLKSSLLSHDSPHHHASSDGHMYSTVHPCVRLMLGALLYHPAEAVQMTCLEVVTEAARKLPLEGINFFSLLLYRLQATGSAAASPQLQLHLLRSIFSLAHHSSCMPYILTLLQKMVASGSPPLLQSLPLRLLSRLWITCHRGWPQLHDLITLTPTDTDDPVLQLSRAVCVRDVVQHDPDKGLQLIQEIQDCLLHCSPVIQSLGLESISLLCEADALDFYAAWKVVVGMFPTLPSHPMPAQQWLALLAHGALDAENFPQKSVAIIELLWSATQHADAQVRRAAYSSLCAYSCDTLEAIEALKPGTEYAALLLREQDEAAREAAEKLVHAVLLHEYARRRRNVGGVAKQGAGGLRQPENEGAALMHRLKYTLPKHLSGRGGSTGCSTAAQLLFFAPPAPSGGLSAHMAALQAVKQYRKVFDESIGVSGSMSGSWPRASCMTAVWKPFMNRWIAATAAALKDPSTSQQLLGSSAPLHGIPRDTACNYIWSVLESAIDSSSTPAIIENCVLAAGALCGILPASSRGLASQILGDLKKMAAEGMPRSVTRCCVVGMEGALRNTEALDWEDKVSCIDFILQLQDDSTATDIRSTAAECTAEMVYSLVVQHNTEGGLQGTPRVLELQALVCRVAQHVFRLLGTLWPQAQHSVQGIAKMAPEWMGDWFDGVQGGSAGSGVAGSLQELCSCMAGLSCLAGALQYFDSTGNIISSLWALLQPALESSATPSVIRAAVCTAVPFFVQHLYRNGSLSNSQVLDVVAVLTELIHSSGDGSVGGSAAAALGAVLDATLIAGLSVPPDQLTAVFNSWTALASAGGKLPHGVDAKAGAAIGMCSVLCGALFHPAMPSSPSSGWLLSSGEHTAIIQQFIQALESLSCRDGDVRCRSRCGTAVGLTCIQLQERGGTGGQNTTATGLPSLPSDSCMRALIEALEPHTQQQEAAQKLPSGVVVSVLHCLAAAKRLPPMNWGVMLKKVTRSYGAGEGADVALSCAEVALNHARSTALSLTQYLEEVVLSTNPASGQPANDIQLLMARRMADFLPLFSVAKSVQHLATVVDRARQDVDHEMQVSLWHGLTHCIGALLKPDGWWDQPQVPGAVLQAVHHVVAVLPLPALFSTASLEPEPDEDKDVNESGDGTVEPDVSPAVSLWRAALRCLKTMQQKQLMEVLPDTSVAEVLYSSAPFLIARSLMIKSGCLPISFWSACRNALLNANHHHQQAGEYTLPSLLILIIGSCVACTSTPLPTWTSLLQDTIASMKVSTAPLHAYQLFSAMMSSRLEATTRLHIGLSQITAVTWGAVLQSPPLVAPLLLQELRNTSHSGGEVQGVLIQQLLGTFQSKQEWAGKMGAKDASGVLSFVCGSLLGLRDLVPKGVLEDVMSCDVIWDV